MASTTLSANICRTSCSRLAPIAARIANSRRRSVARANSRFATLAQAISRTRPTAPQRIKRAERRLLAFSEGCRIDRDDACSPAGVRIRMGPFQAAGERVQFRLCLRHRNASRETAEDHDRVIVTRIESLINTQGHPQLEIGLQKAKVIRQNADHDEGTSVDADFATQYGRVAAEMALPQAGGEYDDLIVAGRLLIGLETAAHGQIDPQH